MIFIYKLVYILITIIIVINNVRTLTIYSENQPTVENYAILMETSSRQVLEEVNSNVKLPVGTLNKLMIAVLIAEKISSGELALDTQLTASANAQGKEGATIWLLQGEKMSVEDLLKGMLIGNANDSTIVLAEKIGGSEDVCIDLMNQKAKNIGMDNTMFKNVCGYDQDGQYSTAYDIALLGCEFLKYDFLSQISCTYMEYLRDNATELVNENYLTRTYNGLTGIKASHSEKSGYSVVASAEKNGVSYLVVALNCQDKDTRFSIAKKLLNKGFNSYVTAEPSFSSEFMKPLQVKGGVDFAVMVEPKELKSITIAKGASDIENVVFLPQYINAPIRKNQRLGEICFYIDDTMIYKTDLISCSDIKEMTFSRAFKKLITNLLR